MLDPPPWRERCMAGVSWNAERRSSRAVHLKGRGVHEEAPRVSVRRVRWVGGWGTYTVVNTVPEIEVLASAVRHRIIPRLGIGKDLVDALGARLQLRLGLYAVVAARLLDLRPASTSRQDPPPCFPPAPSVPTSPRGDSVEPAVLEQARGADEICPRQCRVPHSRGATTPGRISTARGGGWGRGAGVRLWAWVRGPGWDWCRAGTHLGSTGSASAIVNGFGKECTRTSARGH